MLGLNKAYFIGHVGRDPELRTSAKGINVANVTIAVPHRRQQDDGTWVDNPDWHRLTAFSKVADWVSRDVRKGDAIAVECVVRQNKWTDKDGQPRWDTALIMERLLWHGRKAAKANVLPPLGPNSTVADLPSQLPALREEDQESAGEEIPF
jgi:single-strand DNA-binding protein